MQRARLLGLDDRQNVIIARRIKAAFGADACTCVITPVDVNRVVETAKAQIADAVKVAEARENPAASTLFDDVYMNLTPQLKAQRQELADLIAKGGVGADIGHFPL